MAGTINVTGSDIKSTHYAAALAEALFKLQAGEEALSSNPNNVQITINDDTKLASFAATLPISYALSTAGIPQITFDAYVSAVVVPGSGALKGTTLPAIVGELIVGIVGLEDARIAANPQFTLRSSCVFDLNAEVARITALLPYTSVIDSAGKPTLTFTDYL
jgi:hypothetical protein